MEATNSNPSLPLNSIDSNQVFRPDAFFWRRTNSPDYANLNQILTLTLIIKDVHTIKDEDVGKFLKLFGAQYLPYLIGECDNDPLSPYALWVLIGGAEDSRSSWQARVDAKFYRTLLDDHRGSEFDLKFKEFLQKNCQFLLELCKKPARPEAAPDAHTHEP
ncbi:predicted protein [Sclerotinia sclerotiorum 1980 UF-70]|uniref:Uncharacterized protein n=2 Tax=Sclerotinia sclerotiorum (strain ATCC 18683 / 1980 / Ss-1) TaxID=665079 RepID=A7E7C8_SCLS1|nr:predicted protein [Sclerotinia sclerotiorum 1980 UF-70]APA06285.1 hypothetical protein sscle_01g010550 [Sclerotinia sclerotiorum 1980 UF-70]EDN96280.1 predicted protein [Sclerotinia sclerotiorum 1980 UF-70]